ncbi:MAG: hypothetical protein C4520_13625 [Candidatus Abyssobacteria bacterium SURF_5]|uniref:Molecular chaperone TorD n=1 Tax=Abyssobacteria bacterium (strain SURF_5) TaxID=2093360 RepID=A0A3A4NIB7_ABYX5|nr:MAG: hypothetical protein C4520_13625 [Candidatus Abyssubacteria bacterium SURF_5]
MHPRETGFNEELAHSRKNIYQFLAAVFLEKPKPELVERVIAKSSLDDLREIFSERCVSFLRNFAEQYSGDILPLEIEYTHLLVAPLGQYVTPYESVYRDEKEIAGQKVKGLLMGESAVDVKKTIRKIGAEIDKSYRSLPDHIGLELQVMYFLCEQEGNAWSAQQLDEAVKFLEFEEEFLRRHLTVWVPVLTGRILERTKNDFFRGIACMTREFIEIEKNSFDRFAPAGVRSSREILRQEEPLNGSGQ